MDQLAEAVPDKPSLAPGVRLAGEMQESAFVKPPWLIERQGQGYLQVPKPLYGVAEQANGERTLSEIADEVRESEGIGLSPDNVRYLIATQLIPNGVVSARDGKVAPAGTQARSALAISRLKTIDADGLAGITGALKLLYWPPVLLVVLGVAALVQFWVYVVHGVGASLNAAFYTPGFMLLMLLSVVVAAGFHELGHAAALRSGGGTPRSFGFGMYLMYPVFFTDVSDNYRLRRWGRVRTDLGGFYFNLIFALFVFGAYVLTRQEALLVVIVVMNFEIIRQLLPFVRLDGYWTLADLTGIPDFLSKMGAFAVGMLPWKWATQGARSNMPPLKPWARWVFAVYILVTVPALLILFVLMVRSVPRVLATAWDAIGQQGNAFLQARASLDGLTMAGAVGQSLLIALPVAGLLFSLYKLGRSGFAWAWRWSDGSRGRRGIVRAGGVLAALAVLAMWVPQIPWPFNVPNPAFAPGTFQPIGPDERLSVGDAITGAVVQRQPGEDLPGWLPSIGGKPTMRGGASTPDVGSHGEPPQSPPPPPPAPPATGGASGSVSTTNGSSATTSVPGAAPAPGGAAQPATSSDSAEPPVSNVPATTGGAAADSSAPADVQAPASGVTSAVAPVATAVPATANNAVSAVATAVPSTSVGGVTAPVQPVAPAVATVVQSAPTTVAPAVQPVETAVPTVVSSARTTVGSAPTTVSNVVGSAPTTVATVVSSAPTTVATVVGSAPTNVATVVDSAPTTAATVVSSAPTSVATVVNSAPTAAATAVVPVETAATGAANVVPTPDASPASSVATAVP